ncbi:hypothetical protein F5884DRAFT_853398 [Xylogone sp. PMI_703]|nr:hypothetical protein F5884DRAFT_853398 [Xylogone sp. PMI_703]
MDIKPLAPYTYIPKHFFFYGSLMDPLRLQEVLQLPEPPVLKTAKVQSYKIKLWGQYPALVYGSPNNFVDGMAFYVETELQQEMLEYYETEVYSVEGIRILIDGKRVSGRTLMWAGDAAELTDGAWSLEEWERE